MELTLKQRKQEINRVTIWGVLVNLMLSVVKLIGGFLGHSQALIADGIHSLSDLVSDAMVLLAARQASEEADEDHPYGHERFETIATVALGVFLIFVGIGIAWDSLARVIRGDELMIPSFYTLAIALFSILSNEGLYHFTKHIGNKINSRLLIANAWHHRSDAISSIVVLVGITGALFGVPMLDAVAAVIVGLMIVKIGGGLAFHSIRELVDTALEPELVEKIKQKILSIDEVRELHMLRTRRMGHNALVDVHIQVAPKLSVSEGHHISEMVEKALIDSFGEINDVTVHIDPEDDEKVANCQDLPMRTELIIMLKQAWSRHPELNAIDDVTLHYLDGSVTVEATMPIDSIESTEDSTRIQTLFDEASREIDFIDEATLKFH